MLNYTFLLLHIYLPTFIFLEHSHRHSTGSESQNLSILSPFDEKEEWHKISEIINSFGANIGTDVKESTTPNNCKQLPNTLLHYVHHFFFIIKNRYLIEHRK